MQRKTRPNNIAKPKATAKTGTNRSLGSHVFDYGPKNAADQMATTWEQIIIHDGTSLGEDIGNELRNEKSTTIPKPKIPEDLVDKYTEEVERKSSQKDWMIQAKGVALKAIQLKLVGKQGSELITLAVQEAELKNDIKQLQYEIDNPPSIELKGTDKVEYDAK